MKTPVPYLNWHHACYLWCVVIATRPCTRSIGLRCFPLVLRIEAYRKHMEQNVSHNLFVAHKNLILWSSIYVTHCFIFQPNSMAVMLFLMGTACGNFAYQYIPGYLFSLYGVRCFMYILLQNAVCILVLFIAMQLVARTQGTRFSRATPDINSEEDQTDETSRMDGGIKPAGQNAHGEDEIVAIPLNRDISENVVTWNSLSESSSYDCKTILSGMCRLPEVVTQRECQYAPYISSVSPESVWLASLGCVMYCHRKHLRRDDSNLWRSGNILSEKTFRIYNLHHQSKQPLWHNHVHPISSSSYHGRVVVQ